ncbi:hypothetical protein FJZ31_19870 [Candidatus Poribacteria bacterium]|nr:hypothetical protein [Candidatus Poribacteria bacterium]
MYQKIGEINLERLRKDFPWVENNVVYASEWIIEKIRNNHPEMGNYWTELPNLLSNPDKLFRDRDYPSRVVFYKEEVTWESKVFKGCHRDRKREK